MPQEFQHACHNCTSVGEWFAGGAHCWCRRHRQTVATPAQGCAYWLPAKNAYHIAVPEHRTLSSGNFDHPTG
jgi:hypothetical protein